MNNKHAILLFVTGLLLAVKPIYDWLSFGGYPIIQLIIGAIAMVVAVIALFKK